MNESKDISYRQVINAINQASSILVICHKKPDGDALGSMSAIKQVLNKISKKNRICCVDEIPHNFFFLKFIDQIQKEFSYQDFDLIITLDCGADYMTGYIDKTPNIFTKPNKIINIDHHPSNNNFGFINIVDTLAASTCTIIFNLLEYARFKFDPDIATSLLTGIYTDTGSFMHSNTTSKVYTDASKLLRCGAKLNLIVKHAFKTTAIDTLRLWGRVLSSIKVNEEGITMAIATNEDFRSTNTKSEHLSGIVDLINSIPNSKFSVLLNEDDKGNVKGSFRTQEDQINLSQIAGIFGGGGHKKAAGFTIPGKLEKEIRWKIVKE